MYTCVVVRRPSVDGGRPGGLDEPLGTRPALSGPAAEGQVVKVAGEPDVCWEIDTERERARAVVESGAAPGWLH